ncbi:AAA family ATPase [Streptomyces sp. NPDC060205]|uniref:AAA family ATPase n=1 Tax=Streptomyces sp. NPDC060205 TaxID=3347072 RepID=UPI003666945B
MIVVPDDWDDWFQYNTQYRLTYQDAGNNRTPIGSVKIGQFDMPKGQSRPDLPSTFEQLDDRFFSLGQDDSYYRDLGRISTDFRAEVLQALRDVAFDEELFQRALAENVTGTSLLRSVPRATVQGQFRRMAHGGPRRTRYHFVYTPPAASSGASTPLTFDVRPKSQPPTNIHVLIGRNGVGKTHALNHMTRALADERATADEVGTFEVDQGGLRGSFANLVSVTFSAFDPFEPLPSPRNKASGLEYSYIGLKHVRKPDESGPKDWQALAAEFGKSVRVCLNGARQARWRRALTMLESDPIFSDAGVAGLADAATDDKELRRQARLLFRKLSSGHKIVLLTMARLVETVSERSLVLLDEPEAHLHPPLLSAFTRALSDLLSDRNGVAIIATHSPVVLQEVPRSCVWKIRRSGWDTVVERPTIETFGENVGVLTREIFGLEVTHSGFHRLLDEALEEADTYEEVLEKFDGQLGSEARILVRTLLAAREAEGSR